MAGKRIVIVGGGFGGAAAARTARAGLSDEHEVVVLDPHRISYLCGTFPLLIVGQREFGRVARSLSTLEAEGVRYIEAAVTSLDLETKTVRTEREGVHYDYLVLAMGAAYDWEAVPGALDAYSFYDMKTARRLRERLEDFEQGRVIIAVASGPYKCPPAPYETAMILDWSFRTRGIRPDTEIHVHIPEPAPMPIAGEEAAALIAGALSDRGIELHTDAGVTEVGEDGRLARFSDGSSVEADLVITIPVHRVPELVASTTLVNESGWVAVEPETLATSLEDVYAIGDIAMVPMATGKGLPKAGVFASAAGEVVGHNIAAAINGTESTTFDGKGHCFIYYTPEEAGKIQGEFLADGAPKVELVPPSPAGAEEKQKFEEDWRAFRI